MALTFACLLSLQYPGLITSTAAAQVPLGTNALAGASPTILQTLVAPTGNSSSVCPALFGVAPPNTVGCYYQKSKSDAWQSVPCVSQPVLDRMVKPQPPPTIGGNSGIQGLSVAKTGKILTEGYTTAWSASTPGDGHRLRSRLLQHPGQLELLRGKQRAHGLGPVR